MSVYLLVRVVWHFFCSERVVCPPLRKSTCWISPSLSSFCCTSLFFEQFSGYFRKHLNKRGSLNS